MVGLGKSVPAAGSGGAALAAMSDFVEALWPFCPEAAGLEGLKVWQE